MRFLPFLLLAVAASSTQQLCHDAHPDEYGGYAVSGPVHWDGASATATAALTQTAQPELGPDASTLSAAVARPCGDVVKMTMIGDGLDDDGSALVADMFVAGECWGDARASPASPRLNFTLHTTPFGVAVVTVDDGATLFNSTPHRLLVKQRFTEVSTPLPADAAVYGLGERTQASLQVPRSATPRALYAHDVAAYNRDQNLYGAWPLAIVVRGVHSDATFPVRDTSAYGLLFATSAPLDVVLGADTLTVRVVAPRVTVYVLAGPTVADVVNAATRVTGRPALPPAWALGAMQSKWGWARLADVEAVVAGYDAAAIPLDVVFADIDYMDAHRDWTLDPDRYPVEKVRAFVESLHANGRYWVPIVDPGIAAVPGYAPYDTGVNAGTFIRAPPPLSIDTPYVGAVWPGATVWPDFTGSPTARAAWAADVAAFHAVVPYDGAWVDMNEPSNFVEVDPGAARYAPYCINNGGWHAPLADHSVPPLARSADGTPVAGRHNVYGLAEAAATAVGLRAARPSHRPFMLSRSTFPGAGAHGAAHWTGDNNSSWADLAASVPGVLAAGLAGMPLAGADVCGYAGAADGDLCAAWTAAAAWQPLLRNHAAIDAPPQEPFRWPAVAAVARRCIGARYALLPYLYAGMAAAAATGVPVARPLWLHWQGERDAHDPSASAWLLGDAVMVAPQLRQAKRTVTIWLPPADAWCDVWGLLTVGQRREKVSRWMLSLLPPPIACHPGGTIHTLASTPTSPTLLQRGGTIVPASSAALDAWHADGGAQGPPPVRALAAVTGNVTLIGVLDDAGRATGRVYRDDGVTEGAAGAWCDVAAAGGCLRVSAPLPLTRVVLHRVAVRPERVSVTGRARVLDWAWSGGGLVVDVTGDVDRVEWR